MLCHRHHHHRHLYHNHLLFIVILIILQLFFDCIENHPLVVKAETDSNNNNDNNNNCTLKCLNNGICKFGTPLYGYSNELYEDTNPLTIKEIISENNIHHQDSSSNNIDNQYCTCQPGYTGYNCEIKLILCPYTGLGKCYNGKPCIEQENDINGNIYYHCQCDLSSSTNDESEKKSLYSINFCQRLIKPTICTYVVNTTTSSSSSSLFKHSFCNNGGKCKDMLTNPTDNHKGCDCTTGWTGDHCQWVIGTEPKLPPSSDQENKGSSTSSSNNNNDNNNDDDKPSLFVWIFGTFFVITMIVIGTVSGYRIYYYGSNNNNNNNASSSSSCYTKEEISNITNTLDPDGSSSMRDVTMILQEKRIERRKKSLSSVLSLKSKSSKESSKSKRRYIRKGKNKHKDNDYDDDENNNFNDEEDGTSGIALQQRRRRHHVSNNDENDDFEDEYVDVHNNNNENSNDEYDEYDDDEDTAYYDDVSHIESNNNNNNNIRNSISKSDYDFHRNITKIDDNITDSLYDDDAIDHIIDNGCTSQFLKSTSRHSSNKSNQSSNHNDNDDNDYYCNNDDNDDDNNDEVDMIIDPLRAIHDKYGTEII